MSVPGLRTGSRRGARWWTGIAWSGSLLLIGLLWPSSVEAQATRLWINEGERIRVSVGTTAEVFRFIGFDHDTVALQRRSAMQVVRLPLNSIARIEAPMRSRGPLARQGALIGFVLGAAIGAFAGSSSGDDPEDGYLSMTAGEKAFLGGAIFGAGGAALGALVGSRIPTEHWVTRWERRASSDGPRIIPGRTGALAIVYRRRF
jgi:hypothetical protein